MNELKLSIVCLGAGVLTVFFGITPILNYLPAHGRWPLMKKNKGGCFVAMLTVTPNTPLTVPGLLSHSAEGWQVACFLRASVS